MSGGGEPVLTLSGAGSGGPRRAMPDAGGLEPGHTRDRGGVAAPELMGSGAGGGGPGRLMPKVGGGGPDLKRLLGGAGGPSLMRSSMEAGGPGLAMPYNDGGGPRRRGLRSDDVLPGRTKFGTKRGDPGHIMPYIGGGGSERMRLLVGAAKPTWIESNNGAAGSGRDMPYTGDDDSDLRSVGAGAQARPKEATCCARRAWNACDSMCATRRTAYRESAAHERVMRSKRFRLRKLAAPSGTDVLHRRCRCEGLTTENSGKHVRTEMRYLGLAQLVRCTRATCTPRFDRSRDASGALDYKGMRKHSKGLRPSDESHPALPPFQQCCAFSSSYTLFAVTDSHAMQEQTD